MALHPGSHGPATSPSPIARPSGLGGNTAVPPESLGSILSALQPQQPHRSATPQTTFPDQPRAMNPQIMQLIMQLLQQSNPGAQGQQSLGSILGGR